MPLAGNERPAGWQYLRHKFIGAMPSSLSLRGGRRPTWQSRSTRPNCGKAIGENATAFPRLPRAQSALAMTNLLALRHRIRAAKPTACKALNPRKGDAASVRRQSRQRLRSERCYRRNWCIPFSRRPVRIGSLAKLSTFHFLFSTRRMPSPYNAPSIPSFSHKTTASRRHCLRLGAYSQVLPHTRI